jgi:hypothetical protein
VASAHYLPSLPHQITAVMTGTERHFRMDQPESRSKFVNIINVVSLFFGATFLGIILVAAVEESHGFIAVTLSGLGFSILWAVFKRNGPFFRAVIPSLIGLILFLLVVRALAELAAGGTYNTYISDQSSMRYFWIENYLIIAVLWLLVGVPNRAFRLQLDLNGDGNAQTLFLACLTSIATVLSGIYILMLHFAGGPLSKIGSGPLVAGTIFTMFLVAPAYRSVAKACWQRGIRGAFSPKSLRERWGKTLTELDAALYKRAERILASNNNNQRPPTEKAAQYASNAEKSVSEIRSSSDSVSSVPTRSKRTRSRAKRRRPPPKRRR